MIQYRCDGCGAELDRKGLRYTVKIDVHAAYEEMEVGLMDLVRNHRQEILDLIEQLGRRNPQEVEDQIYKRITLDLCPSCQRAFLRDPLRFHPEQSVPDYETNIDAFLRSLGFGETPKEDRE